MADRGSRNLLALDLLRFACAVMVVAFHWGSGFVHGPPPGGRALLEGMPIDGRLSPFLNSGWIGVELFFVVSGFVIAWSAEGSSPSAFAGRRFLRLLPAAWLCASLTTLAMLIAGSMTPGTVVGLWLGSVLFWPMFGIDPSYWTLAIEVNFYLLIALSLLGGATLGTIERIGALLGLASAAYWIASCFVPVPPAGDRIVQLTLLPHGCFFALGMLIRARQRLGWRALRLVYLIPAGIAAVIEIDAHRIIMHGDNPAYVPPLLLFGLCLLPILFAERLQPRLTRAVRAPMVTTLGLMTYPLYLLHQELGAILIGGLLRLGVPFWPACALMFVTMLALSWAVVRFGEPPLRALLKRLGRARATRDGRGDRLTARAPWH
ncbi:acyltransferase [Sphingomonas sp. HF-S4]|uniref:Acyltransferase n=1 Tax=Sphingomonas agrestis TaxID=3080540 RepID=A0ABU3Y4P5_9SPHN|nr:acyltransferase [Sphingomonas sp. HF-S4]MDV3456362.1 acyltransferase [Sphingomonas sp. HF-S4]